MTANRLLPLLIAVFIAQLFVPAQMIYEREDIVRSGQAFKFKTMPLDPNDPFRGKYVSLTFTGTRLTSTKKMDLRNSSDYFALIDTNANGFAVVKSLSTKIPMLGNYVKVRTYPTFGNVDTNEVNIIYPFDRFYMDEYKAPKAEEVYREAALDSAKVTYAKVFIKNGEAVIDDVMIDGKSLRDLAKPND